MTIGRDMTHIKTKKIHLRIFDSGWDDPSEDFLVKCVMSRPWVIIKVLYDTATKKISIFFQRRDGPYQCSCHFLCSKSRKKYQQNLVSGAALWLLTCLWIEGGKNCSFFSSQQILGAQYMVCFFRLAALMFSTRLVTVCLERPHSGALDAVSPDGQMRG